MNPRFGRLGCLALLAATLQGCWKPAAPSPTPAAATNPVAAAERAAQASPNFENLTALGVTFSRQGNHEAALATFERALVLDPNAPLTHNNICAEQNELRHWALAITSCQRALQLEPGFALARANLAVAQKGKADQDKRIQELEKLVQSRKATDSQRIALGMEYYFQGAYPAAESTWRAISEKSAQFAMAQNNLATVYILTQRFSQARDSLGRALKLEPKNTLFLNNSRWLEQAAVTSRSRNSR